ncbi:hypothetical protein CUMW_078560 [Citrus unshiu]|uniref:RRM domain-containing protein n=1 Tax=Citrus unshiu TaxID=55188 RepID=A0A2H5NUZ9_CITUN|nr:hypothetical protein CUMW_078560 [Citrus unshiu]
MGETGISRFQGNLDPRAQEFRPTTLFRPPQVYYPYGAASPPTLPPYASNDVQVVPFGGVGYAQYPTHPQLGVPLPPPSTGPTRTLVLSYVPGDVSETIVRRDLEVFGEVRGVQMERLMEGIVTVHFYDLRHAEMAFKEIREQHMQLQQQSYGLKNPYSSGLMLMNNDNNNNNLATGCYDNQVVAESLMIMNSYAPVLPPPARGLVAGRPVWAQFIVPTCNAVPDGNNQGTIVVFNLDSGVSSSTLKEIFQAFGPVKELRETPLKKHQRFIEFYDVRDAAKALKEMNGQEIYGKHVVIEFSRPGGHSKKFFYANSSSCASSLNYSTIYQTRNSDCPPPPLSADPPSYSPRSLVSQAPHFRKKSPSNSFKGNPNNVNVTCSIEPSVASLSLAHAIEDININPARRTRNCY